MVRIHAVSSSRPVTTIIDGAVAQLIEEVGDEHFSSRLFQAAFDAIGCVHLSAFAFDPQNRPSLIFAENAGPIALAREIGRLYVEQYWRMDPLRDVCFTELMAIGPHLAQIGTDDIRYPDYRHDCYTVANLNARLSICEARTCGTIRLNFYREADFLPAEKSAVADAVGMLMPLLWRHGRDHFAAPRRPGPDFEARLTHLAPNLPRREREVCALIVTGVTSEGIALTLGVSLNTVLTYRKRAYSRLRISSQNELLRLLIE
ncbi:helix-turn-helix transcriptional regulator [Paraburkholderia sediminicola]|uniref:helix-turn-helix transcriptional regulator n=1 Tax=Paraburkholderia sediminicola TaxID=458836 RepID=UPI0038BBC5E0